MPKYPVAVFNSHPIQYFAPLYRYISQHSNSIDLTVYYYTDEGAQKYYDKEFETDLAWDIPLLEGYKYKVLPKLIRSASLKGTKWKFISRNIFLELRRKLYKLVWLHGWAYPASWQVLLSCKILGLPFGLRTETNIINEMKKTGIRKYLKVVRKMLFWQASVLLYIGTQNRRFYEYYGVPEEKLIFAPYTVDNERFIRQSREIDIALERHKLRIPENARVILFSAKLIPLKQPLLLLKAFRMLTAYEKSRPCYLIFVGEGSERAAMEKLIRSENISNVLITGFVNQRDIPKFYTLADLFVLPSNREQWGLSTNEAMCCRCAVVVSDQCGCAPDLVKGNGYIFDSTSVEDLANKLALVVQSDERLNYMKKRSLEIIQEWSYKQIVDSLESWLDFNAGGGFNNDLG